MLNIITNGFFRSQRMATSVCTEDVDCTDNAQQIFWRENEECLLFTLNWSGQPLFLFVSHTGVVVSAMMWRQLKGTPPPALAFIASRPLYKWDIWYYSSPRIGRCYSMLTSSRHGLWPSFSLNKFFFLIINVTAIKIDVQWVWPNPHLQSPRLPLQV